MAAADRFSRYAKRARFCYRAAGQLDTLQAAIKTARSDIAASDDQSDRLRAVVGELGMVEAAVTRARLALQKALEERQPRPENREAEFWPVTGATR